jgi:hypothetical protein
MGHLANEPLSDLSQLVILSLKTAEIFGRHQIDQLIDVPIAP